MEVFSEILEHAIVLDDYNKQKDKVTIKNPKDLIK
jgi:hypothetical protein